MILSTSRALLKGLRPVLEGFVFTMHEGACETGSQIPRLLSRGIWRTVCTSLSALNGTPNRTLKLIFWYQKMIFWYQKLISDIRKSFSDIRKSISDIRKCVNFWYQKIIFWYQKISFWYQKIIFWYQKLFSDIRKCHDFLISEIIFWYKKLFSDIRKWFLISENRNFLWCLLW